jgi:zinc transporter ZupT
MLLSWLLGAVLGLAHLVQPGKLDPARLSSSLRERLGSFTAGLSVTYLFLWLLPESVATAPEFSTGLFVAMLVGFVLLHITEKSIYIHEHAQRRLLLRSLAVEHSIVFFIYYALVGFALTFLSGRRMAGVLLFFIPILLHAFITRAAFSEIHGRIREKPLAKTLLTASPLLGVAIAMTGLISTQIFNVLLGLTVGAFFYIVIKDLLPEKSHGPPFWFLLGTALMTALMLAVGMP